MTINEITDLTGIGKVIESEVVKEVYTDVVSPAAKEMGYLAQDFVKTLRLFTAPFQLAAAGQDRFHAFCARVATKVRRVSAACSC